MRGLPLRARGWRREWVEEGRTAALLTSRHETPRRDDRKRRVEDDGCGVPCWAIRVPCYPITEGWEAYQICILRYLITGDLIAVEVETNRI